MTARVTPAFWCGRRVLVTGHTGFKGGWLALWLHRMQAAVSGLALPPSTEPDLYSDLGLDALVNSEIGDVRDFEVVRAAYARTRPEIVFHLAAQPLVRYSYVNPLETYQTNVMGTAHVLEAARTVPGVRAVVVITTDKCYENREWVWGYRENDPLGGHDPYSSSKGAAELVVAAYRNSYFSAGVSTVIASARAGNVIGGGDWSADRLIPDAVRAFLNRTPLEIRSPHAIRPWQHVLEPLGGYLRLAERLFVDGPPYGGAWNFGPADTDARPVGDVIELLRTRWDGAAEWIDTSHGDHPHEAHFLKLDCSKAKASLGWVPRWNLERAIDETARWYMSRRNGADMRAFTLAQINDYLEGEAGDRQTKFLSPA